MINCHNRKLGDDKSQSECSFNRIDGLKED